MTTIAPVVLRASETEAPRRSARTERGTTNFINDDNIADTIKVFQVQHLGARLGLSPRFASVVASLHFGEVAHV